MISLERRTPVTFQSTHYACTITTRYQREDSMGFSELPTELLILILDSLAIKELLRCKQVCKSLNALVQDETALQYKVQLNLAGMEDGPATNPLAVRDRLRILVEYMEAWDQLRFSEIRTMDRESGNLWELYGNVLTETRSENTTLVIKQLPSKLRGINERTWTLDNLRIPLCDFSTDVAQDLVALLEPRNMPGLPTQFYLHLRTLNTGENHPLATNAQILYERQIIPWRFCTRVYSKYVAILFSVFPGDGSTIFCVWNWKTGELLLEVVGNVFSYAFCTDHHIIMLIRSWAEAEVELLILDMRSANPNETSAENLDYTCSFHLPALRIGRHIYVADMRTDPAYSWSPDDKLAVPFHAAACQSLIVVTLNNQLTFVISVEKLLPYFYNIANVGLKHQILWDMWGPRATRAFSLFEGQSPVWFRNVYRMRFVYLSSHTDPGNVLFVADFNQTTLRKALIEETSNDHSVKEDPKRMKIILEETTLDEPTLLDRPVTTSLPYRLQTMPF